MSSKVNGWPTIVHQCREITKAQFEALSPEDQAKCKNRVNGPHHEAKWAQHRQAAALWKGRDKFKVPFGNHESLAQTYNLQLAH